MPDLPQEHMGDLLVAVPSRGRPENIRRLIKAMSETCRGDTTLMVGLDADDPDLPYYMAVPGIAKNDVTMGKVIVRVRPHLRQVVAWLNEMIPEMCWPWGFRYVGHIGDDNIPKTIGWDVRIMEALDKTPFAFGNDEYPHRAPGSLCCHVFARAEVIRALGYFGPPALRHMYVDNVWMQWGEAAGITYLHDVILTHEHFSVGRGVTFDESYARSSSLMGADQAAWVNYCNDPQGLAADVSKIVGVTLGQ